MALNPLTLLGLISPDHNDALMAGLVLGAVALLFRGRPALAIGVCGLAAAVKAPALIATAFVAWQWAGQHTSWRGRIRTVAAASAITLAVLEVFGLVTRVGWGWVTTLGTPGVVRSVVTPTTDVALLGEWFVRIVKFGPSTATLLAASRAGGYLAVAGITAWLLWRSQRWGTMLTLAISLLVVVALGPVFQPWYLAWGLFCLAPIAVGRWQVLLIAVSSFAAAATLPRFEPLVASTGLAGMCLVWRRWWAWPRWPVPADRQSSPRSGPHPGVEVALSGDRPIGGAAPGPFSAPATGRLEWTPNRRPENHDVRTA